MKVKIDLKNGIFEEYIYNATSTVIDPNARVYCVYTGDTKVVCPLENVISITEIQEEK